MTDYIIKPDNKKTVVGIDVGGSTTKIVGFAPGGKLLSPMFDFAIADGIITLNPIEKVKLARYESEHGVPLTREEEFTLLQELQKKLSLMQKHNSSAKAYSIAI